MANEDLETTTTTVPAADTKAADDEISAGTFVQMLDILDDLTNHTHIFYDDYTTACNCNCNCNCSRGIL